MSSSSNPGGKLAKAGIIKDPKTVTETEWRKALNAAEYYVTRDGGTEPPFTGEYDQLMDPGRYECLCCGEILFQSDSKFLTTCGWPSFWAAEKGCQDGSAEELVTRKSDRSLGMSRVEVRCKKCDAHLGHVFPDGPRDKTGERFCINSISIQFRSAAKE